MPVHVPKLGGTRCTVVPEDVRPPVTIEVAGAHDPPTTAVGHVQRGCKVAKRGTGNAVHVPELRSARDSVVPEKVGLAIRIEIIGGSNGPAGRIVDVEVGRKIAEPES